MGLRRIKTEEIEKIREAIVKTIAFFDLFDYPVTAWEIWRLGLWQNNRINYNDLIGILSSEPHPNPPLRKGRELSETISHKNGFYFLQGRNAIIKKRMGRYNLSDKKFKRAIIIARIFKFIPWVKMIALSNVIGAHNLKKQSDIDLFVITKPKRIWLTRFFCAGLMSILGLRPKPGKEENKICLNFYISEADLNLEKFMLEKIDIYFIYWLACLVPIYNKDDSYDKFIKVNNWLKEYLPNCNGVQSVQRRNSGKGLASFYDDTVDMLLGGLEPNAKKFQLNRLPNNLWNIMNKDTRVVINDQVLKLHVKDRREEYRKLLQDKLTDAELTQSWILK